MINQNNQVLVIQTKFEKSAHSNNSPTNYEYENNNTPRTIGKIQEDLDKKEKLKFYKYENKKLLNSNNDLRNENEQLNVSVKNSQNQI